MSNNEQREHWNGEAGQHWAKQDAMMAQLLEPVAKGLLTHINIVEGSRVLDIGCGGGSQSLMLAEHLGTTGSVVGLDISEPLLSVATSRQPSSNATELRFICGDAQHYDFSADQFDLLFSRFGVMFFDQPDIAFANLRTALCPGGQLGFSCWPKPNVNPFFAIPMQAVLKLLPPQAATDPQAPGPFAFADPIRI